MSALMSSLEEHRKREHLSFRMKKLMITNVKLFSQVTAALGFSVTQTFLFFPLFRPLSVDTVLQPTWTPLFPKPHCKLSHHATFADASDLPCIVRAFISTFRK